MFEVSSRQHPVSLEPFANLQHSAVPRATASGLSDTLLSSPLGPPMDNRSNPEYSQTGLPSPHPSNFGDTRSEESSSIDSASAAQYSGQPEARPSNAYSTSATPTSEYGVFPQSARSGTFSEGLHRAYHPSSSHSGSSGGMAQQPTSPSMPMQDGRNHQNMQSQQLKSDSDEQIDPSLAQPSPTSYNYAQQSPYGPPATEMAHGYGHPGGGMYQQPRPDWANYHGHGAPLTPGHPHHNVFPATPTSSVPQRGNQVYSFVPIPGAQQHKRPRRRYEEIERMYKCGWNGCEKAYGTLNHLNAHVTMQSHGAKRTPEEFKEIRKEWKQRKKEEETQRKAEEERQRQAAVHSGGEAPGADGNQPPTSYAGPRGQVQLPPIGYAPQSQYGASSGVPTEYSPTGQGQQMYATSYPPNSPYPPNPGQSMYGGPGGPGGPHNGGQSNQ